jgi:ESCO1/2 acetyl-transferase/zinc-finger of acetyl-transferase ESCO
MSPKNDEFHVGSPKPISFLRDMSPSPAPRQGLSRTRVAEARRERRGESNPHRTPAALAECQDLLADVVDWKSDSSSDIEKYDVAEVARPGAIDIPPARKGMLVSLTPAGTDNSIGLAPQPTSGIGSSRATNIMNTAPHRPTITVQSVNPNAGALVQTQINLGGQTNVTCQICHFSFNPTLTKDRELHDEYHQNFDKGLSTNGLKPFTSLNVKKLLSHINPDGGENFIVLVHRRSNQCWKTLAITVLAENVDRDLGSQPICESELWSAIRLPAPQSSSVTTQGSSNPIEQSDDRFKVYMYVKHFGRGKPSRVIAVLLAERITHGFESYIKRSGIGSPSNPTCFEDMFGLLKSQRHEAVLGVNKIWVNKRYRRRGLATTLFETARADFIFGHSISRLEVAWTCPTEEGAKFAKKCLKGKAGYDFLRYTDK